MKLINNYLFKGQLISQISWAFVIRIIGTGCGYGLTVLIARKLGPAGAGLYFLCFTVTMIASVIGRLGLDSAILRLIASAAAERDWPLVLSIYRSARYISLAASLTVVVVVLSFSQLIAESFFSEPALVQPLRWMALSIIPISLINLQAEAFKGLTATRVAVFFQNVSIPLLCLILFAIFDSTVVSVVILCQIYFIATLIIACAGSVLWYQKFPRVSGPKHCYPFKALLTISTPLFWIAALSLLMGWMGTLVLGIWQNTDVVGLYSVANRTAALASLVLTVVNTVVAPRFAALYSQGRINDLQRIAHRSFFIMLIIAVPMLLVFLFFAEDILMVFGPEFIVASPVLKILAIGQFVNIATGSVGYLLVMTGHEKMMRNNMLFATIINGALTLMLVPVYGATGAAIAAAASLSMMNIVSLYLVVKVLKINIFLSK